MKISNWGNFPVIDAAEIAPREANSVFQAIEGKSNWIARGMGRCYGDSSLAKNSISALKMNRFVAFDTHTGILTCEAGVTYEDLLNTFVPKGWFPPVTPGTKFVSMGGAVASDVHGKNHHIEGSFSKHSLSLLLMLPSGEIITCSRAENTEIFWATFGGMGLTGIILQVTFRLKKIETAFIKVNSIKAQNLEEILSLLLDFENTTYTVAWIDCASKGSKMGRSILMKGEHASLEDIKDTKYEANPLAIPKKLKLTVPFYLPSFTLNHITISLFNWGIYHKQFAKETNFIQDYDSFFYPLDVIHHWNRIYGKRGFTQYQFVIPKAAGYEGMKKIMEVVVKAGMASFLAVLKTFGKQDGLLSFPMEGYTLTLDFPISPKLFPILDTLDEIVASYGGRIYLTKDVRLSAEMFAKMYPNLPEFQRILAKIDPHHAIESLQSQRLKIHEKPLP